jgi:hypothetical protein
MEVKRIRSAEGCATECLNAHKACLNALEYCLNKGERFAEVNHIRLLRVCAEICRTSAYVLLSHSPFHERTCAVCAEICDACAESCEQFEDELLGNTAQVCRECSDSCLAMSTSEAA